MPNDTTVGKTIMRPEEIEKGAKKENWKKKLLYILFGIVFVFVLLLGFFAFRFPLITKSVVNFVKKPISDLSSQNGRTNILLMGKSGGSRGGSELTDTMILISISLKGDGVKIISIPRDIWIPKIRAKINSAYYWGNEGSSYFDKNASGGGMNFAKEVTQIVVGEPINYAVVVDFSSFEEIVDALGGIEVNVERSFTDSFYPIEGKENDLCEGDKYDSIARKTYACRYETVTFESGLQKMNGETALKYVRSRHAEGVEGTDMAREARQQKIISAIKNKMTEPKTYLLIKRNLTLFEIIKKYVNTDIDLPTVGILSRVFIEGNKNISNIVIPDELLTVPPTSSKYDNLYVFIPKEGNGNWGEINEWFDGILN